MFLFQNEKENGNIEGDVMNIAIIFDDHLITYIDKNIKLHAFKYMQLLLSIIL